MEYKIKKGDTLSALAAAYGTTVSALASANGIKNPNLIYAGDTITIPNAPSNKTTVTSSPVKTSVSNAALAPTVKTTPAYETGKPVYSESQAVRAAYDALKAKEAEKVPEYASKYEGRIADLLDTIENRAPFEYDAMNDPFYRSMRERYIADGRRAMKESAANASALTGGYGNSYGQTAASEAYGRYMSELSGLIPSLYEASLKRYDSESQALLDRLGIYRGLEGDDYSKYRDSVSDYRSELDYLLGKYDSLYDNDYGAYKTALGQWNADRDYGRGVDEDERDYAYKVSRDKEEAAYRAARDAAEDAFKERELALKAAQISAAASKTTTKTDAEKKTTKPGTTTYTQSSVTTKDTGFDYYDLSDYAKRFVKETSLVLQDATGKKYDEYVKELQSERAKGNLTSKEYKYLKSIVG